MMNSRLAALITAAFAPALLMLAGSQPLNTCAVTLRLVDAETGAELPGLVSVRDQSGTLVAIPELLPRGLGLQGRLGVEADAPIHRWWVLPRGQTINLPQRPLTIEAISGLETQQAAHTIELTGQAQAALTLPLVRFAKMAAHGGWRSGNTHLHLMKIDREASDRYLREIPAADGLELLFVSYLERAGADQDYITNRYNAGDWESLSRQTTTRFGNGEEHRHNFDGYDEGYGHVMLLDIRELIQPVSIGPGIMQMGTDGLPLQRGIDAARRAGATVVWCHNDWGREAVPNLFTGRVDAQNIFDGSIRSSYQDSFYRYLNAGLRVPFSTGTDWFLYDFSRVYAAVDGKRTVDDWLEALSEGRTFITNGPLLSFTVDGKRIGDTVALDRPRAVRVVASAAGRADFGTLELIHNGEAIEVAQSEPEGGHFEAALVLDLQISNPCWLAVRTPPPPIEDNAGEGAAARKNEFGRALFAHTSPVYIELEGESYFDPRVAEELLAETEAHLAFISQRAKFGDNLERQRVLEVYRDGISAIERQIARHGQRERRGASDDP